MSEQPSQQGGRIKLSDVKVALVCVICCGYLIDATAFAECLHAFCRSCIIRYLETKSICPLCAVRVNKKNLKADKMLQDLVYKIVPGLFESEMRRRREFYKNHPTTDLDFSLEARGIGLERMIFSAKDVISFSLESLESYAEELERDGWMANRPEEPKPGTSGTKLDKYSVGSDAGSSSSGTSATSTKWYLQCEAAVSMRILKKFVRKKYNASEACIVELFYKTEALPESYTLMDVAYIYTWKWNGPMRFFYRIEKSYQSITRGLPAVKSVATITEETVTDKSGELVNAVGLDSTSPSNITASTVAAAMPVIVSEKNYLQLPRFYVYNQQMFMRNDRGSVSNTRRSVPNCTLIQPSRVANAVSISNGGYARNSFRMIRPNEQLMTNGVQIHTLQPTTSSLNMSSSLRPLASVHYQPPMLLNPSMYMPSTSYDTTGLVVNNFQNYSTNHAINFQNYSSNHVNNLQNHSTNHVNSNSVTAVLLVNVNNNNCSDNRPGQMHVNNQLSTAVTHVESAYGIQNTLTEINELAEPPSTVSIQDQVAATSATPQTLAVSSGTTSSSTSYNRKRKRNDPAAENPDIVTNNGMSHD